MAKILVTTFTVAPWGGLHENMLCAVQSLIRRGHSVTSIVSEGQIALAMREAGAEVHAVRWNKQLNLPELLGDSFGTHDLIFATPQKSRELAFAYAEATSTPVFVQFHGHYADGAATWKGKVERFSTVSGSVSELLTGYCRVDPWLVDLIPNGIADHIIDSPFKSLEQRLSGGTATIVSASRLEQDKQHQWAGLIRSIQGLEKNQYQNIIVKVLGDGSNRDEIENYIKRECSVIPNISVDFTGWLSPSEVVDTLRNALFSVGAGRAALTSLAVGTPVIAAGRSSLIGLATGRKLNLAAWSSFGDNPTYEAELNYRDVSRSMELLQDETKYNFIQREGWSFIEKTRRQSLTDDLTSAFLQVD